LPSVPPSRSPNSTAQPTDRMRREKITMKTVTAAAMMAKIHVLPAPSENAAPGFST
jgi:hypothetical protein